MNTSNNHFPSLSTDAFVFPFASSSKKGLLFRVQPMKSMQHIPFPASRRGLLLTSLIFSSPLLPGAESADKPDAIAAGENASQPAKSTRTTAGKSVAPTELPKLVVTDSRLEEPGYATPVVQSATKTSKPIAKTPISAQVVPHEVIVDQAATKLEEVYRNVSSMAPVNTAGSGIQFENVNIRGFSQRASVDGVNFYTVPKLDLTGIEQVEVLKGPASSLYGMLEPGGMVNVVPKTASFTNHSEISAIIGSYDCYNTLIDVNQVLSPDHLAFRLAGSYLQSDSFRDFVHRESTFLAPSLSWQPAPDTRVTTWLWYQNLDRPVDNGVPFTYNGKPAGDISVNRTDPDHNTQQIDDVVWGTKIEYDVTPDLTLRDRFLLHWFDSENDAVRVNGATSAKNTYTTYLDKSSFHNLEFNNTAEAVYKVATGGLSHEILGGLELSRSDYTYDRLVSQNSKPVSVFQPVPASGPYVLTPGAAQQLTLTQGAAFYLQDQVDALGDKLHVLLGGRFDYVDQCYRPWNAVNQEYTSYDTGLSGRAGMMYEVTPWMSPYVNVCRSFNPNSPNSTNFDGTPLDPTTGLQYEGGFKFALFDKRLALTAATFEITKDNVPVTDPDHAGFSLNGGTLRSRGVEVDVLGQITDELQIIGNYTFADTEVIKSSSLPVGAQFLGIPEQSGSLWLKYTFQEGLMKGFGFGSGVFISGSKAGDNNNTFDLPGYARWDAGVYYTHRLTSERELKVQLNVMNVLDQTYYDSSTSTGSVMPGTPISTMLRATLTF